MKVLLCHPADLSKVVMRLTEAHVRGTRSIHGLFMRVHACDIEDVDIDKTLRPTELRLVER